MKTIALIALISVQAWAACPTDSGYANTCFVALTGNDTTGNGTIGSPYKGIPKAVSVMTAGDTTIMRGGRYTTQTDIAGSDWSIPGCTAASPCTVKSHQGEVVIIDATGWSSTGTLFAPSQGTYTLTPPYNDDPLISNWKFVGLRIENMPRFPFWTQSQNDGITVAATRITGTTGVRFSSCDGCKVLGVHVESKGVNDASSANDPPFDGTPVLPSVNHVPWRADTYSASGKFAVSPNHYQLENVTPLWPTIKAYGMRNLIVSNSVFRKELSSGTDTFGIEYGKNVLIENVRFDAPWSYGNEASYGGSSGGTDSFDMKATGITIRDVQSRGGKAACKWWGRVEDASGVLCVSAEDSAEAAINLAGQFNVSASAHPASETFVPIRYAGNTSDGDAYIVIGNGPYGNSPIDGTYVEISNVPGCTSINKEVRVKESVESKHYIFVLENTDGTQLSCNAAYTLSSNIYRPTLARTATFAGGGTSSITLDSTVSFLYGGVLNGCVVFTTTGTLPSGLTPGVCYYAKSLSGTALTVTTTPQAGTGGSSAMTFSDTGSGTHTATFQDDYTDYAGEMRAPSSTAGRDTWGVVLRNATAISTRATAMSGCVNCTDADFSARKYRYKISNSVFASPRMNTIAAPVISFGGPRAIFSGSTVYLAYHDATTMAVDERISFRSNGVLPTSIAPNVSYYIVASNNGARTIQISTTLGGSAISFSGGDGRHWAVSPGLSTTTVELSSLTNVASSNTVTLVKAASWDDAASLPYPFATGVTYTVDSTSTVAVNGTNVYLAVLSLSGTPVETTSAGTGTWKAYRSSVASNGGTRNYEIGGYTERLAGTGNNTYWTGAASTINSYCAKVEGDSSFNPLSNCVATVGEVETLESGSKIEDPALDLTTGRATSSTPSTAKSRGYYAAFAEVLSVADVTAILRNKFPAACRLETCTVEVDNDSDFSSITETTTITSGGQWQQFVVGKSTPLSASTTYYYRLTQGYDIMSGSFTTSAALSSTATVTRSVGAPINAAHTHARLDVSTDGSSWTTGTNTSCASGCTLTSAAIAKGSQYVRMVRTNSGGTVLATGATETVLVQ